MVCGELPFLGNTETQIKSNILKKKIEYPDAIKWKLSPEIKDLIKQMLMKKVYNRISIDEIYEHP